MNVSLVTECQVAPYYKWSTVAKQQRILVQQTKSRGYVYIREYPYYVSLGRHRHNHSLGP